VTLRDKEDTESMKLLLGTRLASTADTTEVVVVTAPPEDIDLRCGGLPMVLITQKVASSNGRIDPRHGGGTLVGKRYAHKELGVELLCTKGGEGSLAIGDEPLLVKQPKTLPSSD
jgi:hypothetical protein